MRGTAGEDMIELSLSRLRLEIAKDESCKELNIVVDDDG